MKAQPDKALSIDDNDLAIREREGDLAHMHYDGPMDPEPSPLDRNWPKLYVGQQVEFCGCPFIVRRLNSTAIVLTPAVGAYSARGIMDKIRSMG